MRGGGVLICRWSRDFADERTFSWNLSSKCVSWSIKLDFNLNRAGGPCHCRQGGGNG
jgi:hypothetical protein